VEKKKPFHKKSAKKNSLLSAKQFFLMGLGEGRKPHVRFLGEDLQKGGANCPGSGRRRPKSYPCGG